VFVTTGGGGGSKKYSTYRIAFKGVVGGGLRASKAGGTDLEPSVGVLLVLTVLNLRVLLPQAHFLAQN
jgi:hypothetical protein